MFGVRPAIAIQNKHEKIAVKQLPFDSRTANHTRSTRRDGRVFVCQRAHTHTGTYVHMHVSSDRAAVRLPLYTGRTSCRRDVSRSYDFIPVHSSFRAGAYCLRILQAPTTGALSIIIKARLLANKSPNLYATLTYDSLRLRISHSAYDPPETRRGIGDTADFVARWRKLTKTTRRCVIISTFTELDDLR